MWADPCPAWLAALLGCARTPVERGAACRRPSPRRPTETAAERLARHAADRRHLALMDDRLLRGVGLAREAVERGLPFREPAAAAALIPRNRRFRP